MKKSIVLVLMLVLGLAIVPVLGHANDIPDGKDCAAQAAPGSVTFNPNPDDPANADRGAVCVSDGDESNGAEVYAGGEAQAETEGNPDFGGACGAVIVAGMPLTGNPDWDYVDDNGTPEDTSDDVHHHCD
jgi:hypothetical protein